MGALWSTKTTSCPCRCVLVTGRRRIHDWGLRTDLLKSERDGNGGNGRDVDRGNNSPIRHCPQKAVVAHAATAASSGEDRSRLSTSCDNILLVTGGRGGRFEDPGVKLCTPFST